MKPAHRILLTLALLAPMGMAHAADLTLYAGTHVAPDSPGVPACITHVELDDNQRITRPADSPDVGFHYGVRATLINEGAWSLVGLYDHRSCAAGKDSAWGVQDILGLQVEYTFSLFD